jgi:hypothetical protein
MYKKLLSWVKIILGYLFIKTVVKAVKEKKENKQEVCRAKPDYDFIPKPQRKRRLRNLFRRRK